MYSIVEKQGNWNRIGNFKIITYKIDIPLQNIKSKIVFGYQLRKLKA